MNSKAQSALEYLMTYGWALVVIVIVVAALVFMITPTQLGPFSCTGFSKLPIDNFALNEDGIELKITNTTGRGLGYVALQGSFNQGAISNSDEYTGSQSIPTNKQVSATINAPNAPLSGSVTVDINMSYFDGDFTRTEVASCKGAV
ncbi:MAG TPA: hypothetical protein VJG83_03420 [archaeon]|nr:hypothetical protein [archaeon]